MPLHYIKLSPGGNDTILVESPVPLAERSKLANWLMSNEGPGAEQVGFLVQPPPGADARLEMMGGELCINALRSVSCLLFSRDRSKKTCVLSSSGTEETLTGINAFTASGNISSAVQIDVTPRIETLEPGVDLVHLGGISHIVFPVEAKPTHEQVQQHFEKMSSTYKGKLHALAAYGVIPYIVNTDVVESFPVVFVRDTASTVYETGCGSGSIAITLSRLAQHKPSVPVVQPSGVPYEVTVDQQKDGLLRITIGSEVRIISEGDCGMPALRKLTPGS